MEEKITEGNIEEEEKEMFKDRKRIWKHKLKEENKTESNRERERYRR